MDNTLKKALYTILLSLGLALVFNYMFFAKEIGISVFVFVVVLLGTVITFAKYQPRSLDVRDEQVSLQKTWWLVTLIAFFALMPGIRANGFLTFLNVVAIFSLLMMLAHQLAGTPAFLMKVQDYFILAILVPIRMLGRGLSTIAILGQIHSNIKHRDIWIRILKGVAMAVPFLVIFVALFSQADLAFSAFVNNFTYLTIAPHSMQYLVLLAFAFVAGLCYLSYIFFSERGGLATSASRRPAEAFSPDGASKSGAKSEAKEGELNTVAQPNKSIEVLVFLSLIATLFLLFIGFQVTYLFGGEANITSWGFTYAEYARQGFWELLMIAILSLVVLLASEQFAGTKEKKDKRFLVPALVLITEVMVIIISAFKRLSLYIDAYSLTTLRFYVAMFIILLFVLFILLAVKFIKAKPENFFSFSTLLAGATFLIAINLINPDSFIAKAGLNSFNQTGRVDVYYIGGLSADATTQKLELYQKLEGENRTSLQILLQEQKGRLQSQDTNWQSANLSRNRALKTLQNRLQ